jgi:integrase
MRQRRSPRGGGCVVPTANGKGWRLRYWIGNARHTRTVKGTKAVAHQELRRLLTAGDDGKHVAPDKITVERWVKDWLELKKRSLKTRTYECYDDLLRRYVTPAIGNLRMQRVTASDIDRTYNALKVSPGTAALVHRVLKSCFETAKRKALIVTNPVALADVPGKDAEPKETVFDLAALVEAFRSHPSLFPLIATAAGTGMRRNELLGLQWPNIDFTASTITVVNNVESTRQGLRLTTPKTARGKRTFQIDAGLLDLLKREHERHKRLYAGVPPDAEVDLTLVKLPPKALVFPAVGRNLEAIRHPDGITTAFSRWARDHGFPGVRFHDIRAMHETSLLDAGVPIHTIAKRCGHDPAMLMRRYARRTTQSDSAAATAIGGILMGVLNR